MLPSVSVVIPSYNCASYLPRALDSVLAQHYPAERIEVLVVDDGSRDDSAAIAGDYAQRDRRIQVLMQPNGGPAAARNRGIRASHGELIAFLDADDCWQPDKIAAQVRLFLADPTLGLIYCGYRFIDEKGTPIERSVRKQHAARGHIVLDLFCEFFLVTSTVIVPRHCLDAVGLFDTSLRVSEDNDLFLRLLLRYRADLVDAPLVDRTVRADSLSRRDYRLDVHSDLLVLDRFLAISPEFGKRHRLKVAARYAQILYDLGYDLLEDGDVEGARVALRDSLRRQPSWRALKTLLRSALPPAAVRLIRSHAG